jgi:hypothetical protein
VAQIEFGGLPNSYDGWRSICARVPVYLNKKRNLVVKCPRYIDNPYTPKKFRVPTIKLDEFGWVAQPYCQKVRRKEAVELLRKKLKNCVCDLHHLNVGWYNGKPVLFDW